MLLFHILFIPVNVLIVISNLYLLTWKEIIFHGPYIGQKLILRTLILKTACPINSNFILYISKNVPGNIFGLVSLFQWHIKTCGLFNPKIILIEEQQ